jgi:large subunit ribosomal protein L17e
MFFDLLNIKTPEWYQTFIDGRRLTSKRILLFSINPRPIAVHSVYRKTRDAHVRTETEPQERTHHTLKLTDQYIALMVLVFTNAGLLDVRIYAWC